MKKSLFKTGIALIILGAICIIAKGLAPEYIDSEGILREYFFLLPVGFVSLFGGAVLCIVSKLFK